MSDSTGSVIKALILPAIIALILYLALAFVVIPFWRHHRERYSHYVPLNSLSTQTSGLRDRLADGIATLVFNPPWRVNRGDQIVNTDGGSEDGVSIDGEELGTVEEQRRRALIQAATSLPPDNARRLSRDLEEGFMDDSDDEENTPHRNGMVQR